MLKSKKTFKRVVALALSGISAFSLAACGGGGTSSGGTSSGGGTTSVYNDPNRENTTHIIAVVTGGGIGDKWLDYAAERFAQQQYEHSYATGKQGVYIETKDVLGYSTVGLSGSEDDMFFLGREIATLRADDSVLDITEFVKAEREGGSLESRMLESAKSMCTDVSGNYYALPHMELYGGLNYDREAFDASNAYFAAEDAENKVEYASVFSGGALTAYMVGDASDKKSAGPDGAFDTEDDGLPSSLEELLILFDYFYEETDYAPIVFTGAFSYYTNYLLAGLWAALAGVEKMHNYYNVTGEIEVVKTDAKGTLLFTNENLFPGINYIKKPQLETITLNASNAKRVLAMKEKYYAMATLEILERQGWISDDVYEAIDHHAAQRALIMQGAIPTYKKAAMLIEASYWYNEATNVGSFNDYELFAQKDADDRDLRFMCLPTRVYTEETAFIDDTYGNPLIETSRGIAFLNSNLKDDKEVRDACLDFLAFLYTDEELAAFTAEMNLPIAMKYSLSNDQLDSMTNFGRRLWKLRDNTTGSNIIYNTSNSSIYRANYKQFYIGESCDALWTKFDAFDGIDSMNQNGYFAAIRRSEQKNPDGTYKTGTKKLFESTYAFQNSRFTN